MNAADRLQNLCRTAFSVFGCVQRPTFAALLVCHAFRFYQQTAEPVIGYTVFLIIWIHSHRQPFQSLSVSSVNFFLPSYMLFQIWDLTPHHSSNHIAHPIIIAKLFMLIPGSCLPGLGRPFSDSICIFFLVGKQYSTRTASNDLIAIKANNCTIPKASCLASFIGCAKTFCCVLNQKRAIGITYGSDFINLCRCTVKMCQNHNFHIRIDTKCPFQCLRRHIPCLIF